MTDSYTTFTPDWIEKPGSTILDIIEERGWSQAELAKRLGYTEKHVSQLINGRIYISHEAARRLSRVLGSSVDFWLKLEANYQKELARLQPRFPEDWLSWVKGFPIEKLSKIQAINISSFSENNNPEICQALLNFFSVASPGQWRDYYGKLTASFRRTKEEKANDKSIATWLRLGEIEIEKIDSTKFKKYNNKNLQNKLEELRSLTVLSQNEFIPRLVNILAEIGIRFVIVESIPGAHVSGVLRWLSPTKPFIQLSLYGKSNDKFWFNFFHEIGHLVLHSKNKDTRSIFLDDLSLTHDKDSFEIEANQWAKDLLIPCKYNEKLKTLKTENDIIDFAHQIKLHPGIIVGRLQHEKIIHYSKYNNLKINLD